MWYGKGMSEAKRKAQSFLKKHQLAALATVSQDNVPYAASVYYVCDANCNLYFVTREDTQKAQNISHDSRVSMVITDEDTAETVQLVGLASVVEDHHSESDILEQLWRVTLHKQSWPAPVVKMDNGELQLIKIEPAELKYGDFKPVHLADGHDKYFKKVI